MTPDEKARASLSSAPETARDGVSIVMAAHNAEKRLPVLFESLCRSTYGDFEVCLCDDASTDGTEEAIRRYQGRLNIRWTRNARNEGVTSSRIKAFDLSTRPLVLFLDADVRLYPDTVSSLLSTLSRSDADVVVGAYSPLALDSSVFSQYYALFIHHSFQVTREPMPYNVFDGWCTIAKRAAMEDVLKSCPPIPKGVEIENETLGRRIVSKGYSLVLDPRIAVDHHWDGHPKLLFIFTRRVYWWVKIFFATGFRFEAVTTTRGYGLGTMCLPLSVMTALAGPAHPAGLGVSLLLGLLFLGTYFPFYAFVFKRRGAAFAALSLLFSAYFSFIVSASALYSAAEEAVRLLLRKGPTLDPAYFQGRETPKRSVSHNAGPSPYTGVKQGSPGR